MLGSMALVVLFYFTEYLGISPGVAGTLIFISRLWDIAGALLIGQWSDRTKSRWGRRLPFLIAGGPLSALAFALLFAAPESLDGRALEAYVLAALILFATGYSLFVVPYLAVPAEITEIPRQRTTMMIYRVMFMTVAGLIVAVLGPVLIKMFGGGRAGYMGMGAVLAVIVLGSMWVSAALIARAPAVANTDATPGGGFGQLGAVLRNRPFAIFIGVKFFQLMAAACITAALLYLARYVLGQDESFLIRFGALQMIGTFVSLPAWAWAGRRFGKRRAYMGAGFAYAGVALSWLIAALGEPAWVTDIRLFMIGAASAGILVMGFSLLPDTMDHNTKTSGLAQEGTMAAIYSMVEKGTAAVGPLIGGLVLEASGFVSAAGGAFAPEQPRSAVIAIFALVSVIPALCNIAGSLLLTRFDLGELRGAAEGRRP
jgi:GPH family glycoside/pentoside/hexuronide:cation symporter